MSDPFEVDGLHLLLEKMRRLDAAAGAKLLRDAGKDAMKPVLKEMISRAHVGDEDSANIKGYEGGDLRDSIVMRSRIGSGKSKDRVATVSVGPLRKRYRGRALSNVTQKALGQEYGNKNFKADPFIRNTLDSRKVSILNNLQVHFRRRFEKIFGDKK